MAPRLVLVKGVNFKKCIINMFGNDSGSYTDYGCSGFKVRVYNPTEGDDSYIIERLDEKIEKKIVCPWDEGFFKIYFYPTCMIVMDTTETAIYDHDFNKLKCGKGRLDIGDIIGCSLTNDPEIVATWSCEDGNKHINVEVDEIDNCQFYPVSIYHNDPQFRFVDEYVSKGKKTYHFVKFGYNKPYSCKVNFESL